MNAQQSTVTTFATIAVAGIAAGYGLYKLYSTLTGLSTTESLFIKDDDGSNQFSHIDPDSLTKTDREQLLEQFTLACDYMNSKYGKALPLSNQDKLRFYAYYKTATVGGNNTPKPSLIDFERVAMWNAWNELNGTAKVEAMIAYVEQVHRLDPQWREKVTSKALAAVLGENSTMVCNSEEPESDDDEENDRLFEESRKKSLEELDSEQHERSKNRKLQLKEEKQKQLMQKFTKNDNNDTTSTLTTTTTKPVQQKQESSQMGPVFSSLKTDEKEDDDTTLESTTITIGENEINNTQQQQQQPNQQQDEGEQQQQQILEQQPIEQQSTIDPNPHSGAHCMYSNETYIRLCANSNFSDLTELDNLTIFQDFIENENILAVTAKHTDINPEVLKNDQEQLFSYKVVLVDNKRVTLIHQVAESGKAAQCGILLHTFHYPIDLPNVSGSTPLMLAIGNENFEMVQYLISQGANVLYQQQDGTTVEDLIELCDNTKLQQYLIEKIAEAKNKVSSIE